MAISRERPVRGTAVGFEIRSDVPFVTLRDGGGTQMTVTEGDDREPTGEVVMTWRPRRDNPFEGRLLRTGAPNTGRWAFWTSDAGWFGIDSLAPAITIQPGEPLLRRELRLLGVPFSICTFAQGDISIHASAVEIDGRAVLLAGPGHAGKTTLAAALAAAGHRLLSEDSTRCRLESEPLVFPGPASVRLRMDVAHAIDLPATQPGASDPGRVPLILDQAARGSGRGVPLAAILILRSRPGAATVERRAAALAIRDLLALTFHLPTSESRAEAFHRVARLCGRVATYDLVRPMRLDALPEVVRLVERHVRQSASDGRPWHDAARD